MRKLGLTLLIAIVMVSCDKDTKATTNEPVRSICEKGLLDKAYEVIIGSLDWKDVSAANPRIQEAAMAVGYLSIPEKYARCTAWFFAPGYLMTNNHCVSKADDAEGVVFTSNKMAGVDYSEQRRYKCDMFIQTSVELDFTVLKCEEASKALGLVHLAPVKALKDQEVFVIHQNCDYYTDPMCTPNKIVSKGEVLDVEAYNFYHDADTLGGSSGSPVFNMDLQVIGIHNTGYGNDGGGRGYKNGAMRMDLIAKELQVPAGC